MDCKQFQKVISALVDNELNEDEKKEAQVHLKKCLHCFFDYKVESIIKYLVKFRFKKSTCPESLKNQIASQLVSQTYPKLSIYKKIYNLINQPKIRYAIPLVLILSGISYLLIQGNSESELFLKLVHEKYHNIKNHNFPEKTIFTSDYESVKQFLSANGILNPALPITDWKILIAGVDNFNNLPLAYLLFQCEDDTVYFMEIDDDRFDQLFQQLTGKNFLEKLKTKKFLKYKYESCLIVLHHDNNKILVYTMDKNNEHAFEELVASLE